MRRTAALLLTALLVFAARGKAAGDDSAAKDRDKVDKAIAKALVFLKDHQQRDGTWNGRPRGGPRDPAITALSVMAFLSAGHVPGEGPYGSVVEKGVRAVMGMQQKNGLIATQGNWEMYQHGICTLMLAEAAGMTPDPKLAREIRASLARAVDLILKAQRKPHTGPHRGGWRYRAAGNDSDMSVTGWQLLALRSAKNLGCDVPGESIDRAIDYIRRSQDKRTGGFRYQAWGAVTLPCTGTGILALEICDPKWHDSDDARKARAYLLRSLPHWDRNFFSYGIYYFAQAGFQSGGQYWQSFRPKLHKLLFDQQQTNGCWMDRDGFGPNFSTAMAVLALAVEYRYLPIYQRGEDQGK